jgi:malyl-CoA/(S)-citramalyl-CoA lyase
LGCEGKWAIHPSQVGEANRLFSPRQAEIDKARAILQAMAEAQRDGRGAASLDARMIDLASVRQVEVLVRKADELSARTP